MDGREAPTPTQLLHLAREGQKQALGQLLDIYRSYLMLCLRLQINRQLRGKFSASDVVQDTFLQAQRAFPQFRGTTEQEFVDWLRKILASRLAKAIRRYHSTQRRDVALECQLEAALEESSRAAMSLALVHSSPSEQAARAEQAVRVAKALDRLPVDYREIIVLRHFQGQTFRAIADEMGRTENAVKKTWARALVALRKALGGLADEA